jgi:hypothetical protein
MEKTFQDQFLNISEKVIGYLPSFFAGLLLIGLGWVLGWLAKRIVIQLSFLLHLERYLTRFRWAQDLSRADVRFGFYNFIGNIVYLVVFLVFLDNALITWHLSFLSNLLEKGILLFPKVAIALFIFGFGWLIALWTSKAIHRSLRREQVPRASLIAKFAKLVLLLLFSAMALVELNVAREIVLIGFATIIITLGVLAIVITVIGGKELVKSIQETLEDE